MTSHYVERVRSQIKKSYNEADKLRVTIWLDMMLAGKPFTHKDTSIHSEYQLELVYASKCYSCEDFTLWSGPRIVYPDVMFAVAPADDMPKDVWVDFEEAASIVDRSPRGAAALLRLALQKLMPHLDETSGKLNVDIASLVTKGLPFPVQQALDIVRVVGNNAVHPGQIDLKDDRVTAIKLFNLINLIVETSITQPKQIAAMFDNLPADARNAIAKRDGQ